MVYSVGGKIVPDQAVRFFDLKNVHGMKYTGRDYYDVGVLRRKLAKPAIFFAGADEQVLNKTEGAPRSHRKVVVKVRL